MEKTVQRQQREM